MTDDHRHHERRCLRRVTGRIVRELIEQAEFLDDRELVGWLRDLDERIKPMPPEPADVGERCGRCGAVLVAEGQSRELERGEPFRCMSCGEPVNPAGGAASA